MDLTLSYHVPMGLIALQRIGQDLEDELILRDLEVNLGKNKNGGNAEAASREFLAAMEVEKHSQFAGQTAAQSGIDKLPGVVLICIERPLPVEPTHRRRASVLVSITTGSVADDGDGTLCANEIR